MSESDSKPDEEKLEFTPEGESFGYISLDQARVLSMRTARESPGVYGRRFRNVPMVFEVVVEEETEDYYVVTLSVRPAGTFTGSPGQEQFFIEKEGIVAHRQVMALPTLPKGRRLRGVTVIVGLAMLAAVGVVVAIWGIGGEGDALGATAVSTPTSTLLARGEPVSIATSTAAPIIQVRGEPVATAVVAATKDPSISLTVGGTISGRVYEAEGGEPVARVRVFAEDQQSGIWITSTNSESDGAYTLTLPSGTYTVKACPNCEGIGAFVDQYFGGGFSPRRQDGTPVSVTAPNDSQNIDFPLTVGGVISGRVFLPDGQTPVGRVKVNVEDLQARSWVASRHTGPDGGYSLSVPSGSYILQVCPNCSALNGYVDQFYGSGPSPRRRDATPVTVTAPEVSGGINFVLEAGGTVSGRVHTANGRTPIARVNVHARDFRTGEFVADTDTAPDGTYALTLPAGTYAVTACPNCTALGDL